MRRIRGFTLVELLVVIIIISVLLALLLPAVAKAMCNAKAGKAKTLVRQIETGAEQYEKEQNVYPAGNGTNSTQAYGVLTSPGPRGLPYLQKNQGTDPGYFVNPVNAIEQIKFRNNMLGGGNNALRIDIWCSDCDEIQAGNGSRINNW